MTTLFSYEVTKLTSVDQIKENQDALIMFSTSYCPWCVRQTHELESIQASNEKLQIFNVKDKDPLYKELVKKYTFTIRFYPTTFIVEKDGNDLYIKYEFQGYQSEENILKILNDKDNF